MSRLSYGGDMFSPIRCNSSFDDLSNPGRESDIFFEQFKDCLKKDNTKNKKKDISKGVTTRKKSPASDIVSVVKSRDSLFGNTCTEDAATVHLTKNKDLNMKKKSSLHNKKLQQTDNSFQTSVLDPKQSKLKNKKDDMPMYVTVRSEARKSNELRSSRVRQSNCASTPSLPGLAEEQCGKKSDTRSHSNLPKNNILPIRSAKQTKSPTNDCTKIKQSEETRNDISDSNNVTDFLTGDGPGKNSTLGQLSNVVNQEINEKCASTVEPVKETDLLFQSLSIGSKKNTIEKPTEPKLIERTSNSQSSNPPQQIYANIIEKLVKDAVSYEFDGIRQMLYLQQLSLIKHMDKNLVNSQENSANFNILINIIDNLMEENRRLKDIIARQNL